MPGKVCGSVTKTSVSGDTLSKTIYLNELNMHPVRTWLYVSYTFSTIFQVTHSTEQALEVLLSIAKFILENCLIGSTLNAPSNASFL